MAYLYSIHPHCQCCFESFFLFFQPSFQSLLIASVSQLNRAHVSFWVPELSRIWLRGSHCAASESFKHSTVILTTVFTVISFVRTRFDPRTLRLAWPLGSSRLRVALFSFQSVSAATSTPLMASARSFPFALRSFRSHHRNTYSRPPPLRQSLSASFVKIFCRLAPQVLLNDGAANT